MAYRLLSRQALSTYQMREKLKLRKVAEEHIEGVIEELLSLGYLNDEAWGEALIRGEVRKRKSAQQIESKLYRYGVPPSQAKALIEAHASKVSDREQIAALLEKMRRQNRPDDKIVASLMRKGFSYDDIAAVLAD